MDGILQLNKRESGFTFIETLMSMAIIAISLPFILYLLMHTEHTSQIEMLSVDQFFIFIRNDILNSKEVSVDGNTLRFTLKDDEIGTIQQYNNLIRRQVSGLGHEIYLRNVAALTLTNSDENVIITITTLKGETYERTFKIHEA